MTGLSAAIISLLTTHPEGLTAAELTMHIKGRAPERQDNSINLALYRLKRARQIEALQHTKGAIYFLYEKARTCSLELALREWNPTVSEKLREEHLQVSEAE